MSDGVDNLTDFEKSQMLRFLLHFMSMDVRHKLMAEQPIAYYKLCDETVSLRHSILGIISEKMIEIRQ